MNLLQAALLGAVQGFAEFLPISSSGHLVLFQEFFGLKEVIVFDVVVHIATLFAVMLFFWKDLIHIKLKTISLVVLGSIPVVIVGLLFKDAIESLVHAPVIVSGFLFITATFNYLTDKSLNKQQETEQASSQESHDLSQLSPRQAVVTGIFQAMAILPGVSRSGSTLFGATLQGVDRKTAFTYSFLLSLPAVGGASLLQLKDVYTDPSMLGDLTVLAVGFVSALVFGLLSLGLLKYMVHSARFEYFAYYCAFAGTCGLVYFGLIA